MKRTTPELNKVWGSRALRTMLMILPLGMSGCFDDKKTDPPPAASFDLTVSVTGSGQVTSSPAGIACGSDCAETLASGSTLTLSATPASGAMFTGWGGDCSGSTPSCTLTMSASRAVTASFTFTTDPPPPAAQYTLSVNVTGSGSVSSSPAGILCPSDCSETLAAGSNLTLTATPASGYTFTGWSGDCSGSMSCTPAMSANRAVTATFTANPPPAAQYTLSVSVTGTGSVSSTPAGIFCGADCTENYTDGTSVTLTATPGTGFQFSSWSGACSGPGNCSVAMSAARSVSASFTPVLRALTVAINGTGSVTSTPAGITCGTDCSENYTHGSNVTLTASPGANQQFSGWLVACSGTTTTCTVAMTEARSVTATFTPIPAAQFTLTVSVTGTGSVSSTPAGISCGADCTESYASGASVTLTATPEMGFQFSGWGGACSGSGACVVVMSANRTVAATFTNSTTQILFEEHFDNPGLVPTDPADFTYPAYGYGFDYHLFGWSSDFWPVAPLLTGGVNNGPTFRTTSTFDAVNDPSGANYYFRKDFTGALADHSRDFWIRQCLKYSNGYLDVRNPQVASRPNNPKINFFIGDGGGDLNYTMTPASGAFRVRERVVGQSGARADFFSPSSTQSRATNIVGTFQAGEMLVGQESGASAVFSTYTPRQRTFRLNHFWHPSSLDLELFWYDATTDHYFGANNSLNQIQHTNLLLLQEHYDEWMCLETHIDLDQVPWLVEIYVTTAPGAAALPAGATALDTAGRRQFNDYLYIRYSNPIAPALERDFGVDWNEYGAYGGALPGDQIYFDEYLISTGKVGHPFR